MYNTHFRPSTQWLSDWKKDHPGLKGKFIVVLPARLTRLKGHRDFLEIVKTVADSSVPVHGLVVGGAHPEKQGYLREIEHKTGKLGLRNLVTFLGHRDDLREIMSIADVVMSLSDQPESFGRTVLESLSLGTPVIAYDHGGAGEVLREIFPEGSVRSHDVNGASKKLVMFYHNRPLVAEYNPFTLSKLLDKTIALYEATASIRHGD